MFADNHRISHIQMERQYQLTFIAPVLLYISAEVQGWEGILAVLLAEILLCGWLFFMKRQTGIYREWDRYWGKWMSRLLVLVYQSFLLLTGIWLLRNVSELISTYMIQGIAFWLVSGIFLFASLSIRKDPEVRGRFAETAWPVLGCILGILFLAALFQGLRGMWAKGMVLDSMLPLDISLSWPEVWNDIGVILVILAGTGLFPFAEIQQDGVDKKNLFIFRMAGKLMIWLSVAILLLYLYFGSNGTEALRYPMLDLMTAVKLPGGFLRRLDLFFLTVLLFGLLFSMSSLCFYSGYLWEKVKAPIGRWPLAILVFILANVERVSAYIEQEYQRIICYIYLPFFFAVLLCQWFLRRKNKPRVVAVGLLCMLCLSGCQIVEPEKRAYPLVMGIDWNGEEYEIYLGIAQIAESTGQGKVGAEEDSSMLVLRGRNQEEIQESYDQTQELYLDVGHIQAVVFSSRLWEQKDRILEVLKAMEQENHFGNSAYIFKTEALEPLFAKNGSQVESLGDFLTGLYENRMYKEESQTLMHIYRWIHNMNTLPSLPELKVSETEIRLLE